MSIELAEANVVLTAHQFNPSIIREPWLIRAGIIGESELIGSYMFSDTLIQLETAAFHLVVIPPRAQFTLKGSVPTYQETLENRFLPLIQRLPETPYHGIGLNFVWKFAPEQRSVQETCRQLFWAPRSPVHQLFDTAEARFGSYLSKEHLGFRLKLDVKPAMTDSEESIIFLFNAHREIARDEDASGLVMRQILQWSQMFEETRRVVSSVEGL